MLPQTNQNQNAPVAEFKLVVIGDGGVGKTTYVKRHLTGEFQKPYIPTRGAECNVIDFYTNHGKIRFHIWDTAGQEKFGNLRECYYIGAHCAIIMFDLTSRQTYKNVPKWHKDLVKICENIPIVLVGNKADVKERKLKARQINFHRKRSLQYFDVSAKSNYQYEKPFVWLLKQLVGDPNLVLTQQVLVQDPSIYMSADMINQLQKERKEADKSHLENALPDMDEDF